MSRFTRFEIYPRSLPGEIYSFAKDFTIEVSADGKNWTTVVSKTDHPPVTYGNITFEFGAVNARYIRFNVLILRPIPMDSNRYRLQMAEFEVYDDTPDSAQTVIMRIDELYASVNGEKVRVNDLQDLTPIFNQGGRTMVPFRFIATAFGADVDWDGDLGSAVIDYNGKHIVIPIDKPFAMLNCPPCQDKFFKNEMTID